MKQLLLLISFFISSLAFAQKNPGKVIGSLKDAKDESLPDATISVMQAKDSSLISFTRTSNSGYFEIKNLDTGSYYLLISYQGFSRYEFIDRLKHSPTRHLLFHSKSLLLILPPSG